MVSSPALLRKVSSPVVPIMRSAPLVPVKVAICPCSDTVGEIRKAPERPELCAPTVALFGNVPPSLSDSRSRWRPDFPQRCAQPCSPPTSPTDRPRACAHHHGEEIRRYPDYLWWRPE